MRVDGGSWWNRMGSLLGLQTKQQKADHEVEKALVEVTDADPQVRRSAAWRLGKLGSGTHEVVEALSKLMQDHNEYVRRAATWALKNIESK